MRRSLAVEASPAKAAWMVRFWKVARRAGLCVEAGDGTVVVVQRGLEESAAADDGADTAGWQDSWTKKVESALRKVDEEDLGHMDAPALLDAVREGGTGSADLGALEDKLSVLAFFCTNDGHVRLVGARKKLEKKCADIRNLLSHYHWRMSGKDVSFDQMVAQNGKQ
eukprot:g7090.t1